MSDVQKFHSAIRWGKTVPELEVFTKANSSLPNAKDEQNGNQAIHLSTQNGHYDITRWLLESGANVNGQNGKGQTALHMSVAYDFFAQTKLLLDKGADKSVKNGDGNAAITGIDGDKVGPEAWDSPVQKLKACDDAASMNEAFKALEGAKAEDVDKAQLVQTGMKKKNEMKGVWDHAKFMELAKKF